MPPNAIVRVRLAMSPSTQDPEFMARTLELAPGAPVTLGRASTSDVSQQAKRDNALFGCPVVSRKHAQLIADVNPWAGVNSITIKELGSTHGTFVNGERLSEGEVRTLVSGDQIKLGDRVMNGSKRHDGVVFEYTRIYDDNTSDSRADAPNRGYYVPSDNEYDFSSEDEEGELAELTPLTTPEQPKHSLPAKDQIKGSQAMPIDIEAIDADDILTSELHEDHQNHVPDTFDQDAPEAEDDEADADHVSEYGDLSVLDDDVEEFSEPDSFHDNGDVLSASDASDLQSSIDSLHDEDEVEWDNEPDGTDSVQDLTPTIVSPELGSTRQQTTMHYDPVRGSQPPAVPSTVEDGSSQNQPDGSQASQKSKSRWDMPPANPPADLFTESQLPYLYGIYAPELPMQNFNGVAVSPPAERDSYLLPADHMSFPHSPVFNYPLDAPASTQGLGLGVPPASLTGSTNKGETPSSKDRMSIPHIVETQPSSLSKKRKVEEMSIQEPHATALESDFPPVATKGDLVSLLQEQAGAQAPSTSEERPSKKVKSVTAAKVKFTDKEAAKRVKRAAASAAHYGTKAVRVGAVVAKYSTVAAAGAIGMFAWLCSDQAEQLVSRLT